MRGLLFLCLVTASAQMSLAQTPAEPPFRMELVQNLGVSFEGPRNCWSIVNTGGGTKVAFIDSAGSMLAYRLVSWDTTNPAELAVRDGALMVKYLGRTYQFAQQVRYEHRLVVAPVTRVYQGLIFQWPHTQHEWVQVAVPVYGPQWQEVLPPPTLNGTPRESSAPVTPSTAPSGRQRAPDTTTMT